MNTSAELAFGLGSGSWYVQPQGSGDSAADLGTGRNFLGFITNNASGTESLDLGHFAYRANQSSKAHNALGFAMPIPLVQRRNKGAYHGAYNPSGANRSVSNDGASSAFWWQQNWTSDVSECFTDNGNSAWGTWGRIASNLSGRDDGKFYDAIYSEDVIDLRVSAYKPNLYDLLTRYEQKALSAEIRGYQSVPFLIKFDVNTGTANGAATSVYVANNNSYKVDDWLWIETASGEYVKATITGVAPNGIELYTNISYARSQNTRVAHHRNFTVKSNQPTHTDIVGDPTKIKAMLDAKGWDGIAGQWLPFIPNNSTKAKLSEKVLTAYTRQYTSDNGATWISGGFGVDTVSNEAQDKFASHQIAFYHYQTQAKFLDVANNDEVLAVGDANLLVSSVNNVGGLLLKSCIDKVGKYSGAWAINESKSITSHQIDTYSGAWQTAGTGKPKHDGFDMAGRMVDIPAAKVLTYLTHDNGQLYLQFIYKELKYNSDWGDTNDFTIVNGESVVTDDNGQSVSAGQKRVALPYFYSER
ncbi:hypothetical protein [Thalassotalea euphylliae]|uniref:Uncharacterized protein n=1 Tax=Thalassotalea euphylliae TaxID=1655234 RepID=A0A3E0U9K8_9GAMM|nr:hypothetical protein [Thalassotalea euphylliae]REL32532.1 hypothetical protein DXX94_18450 [Thalassotalea euphylliae]